MEVAEDLAAPLQVDLQIASPIAPPIASPIASPIAPPIASPIASQIAPPMAPPIASQIAPPIASPMATPEYIEQQIKLGVEEYLSRTSIIKVPPRLVVPVPEVVISLAPRTQSISQNLTAERLKARRQATAIPYIDLYSSDRRRNGRQVPESATYTDAKAALMTSNSLPVMSLAVGLETRELWMMSSLRPPGINGLI